MARLTWPRRRRQFVVFTDGAIRPAERASGLAAVARDEHGRVCAWWSRRGGPMTSNEAEFAAAVFALEALRARRPCAVAVYSDSRILVEQMQGLATARAATLRPLHTRLRELVAEFDAVTFHHIPRTANRLADALANEAVERGAPGDEGWNASAR